MRNQRGFTLIELVVVIVILGVLSAVAVPKFLNMQDDAYQAKIKAVRGAFKTGIIMLHGKSLASQTGTGNSQEWLDLNGDGTTDTWDPDVEARGSWPYPTRSSECSALFNAIMDEDVRCATDRSSDFRGRISNGVCTYTDMKSGDSWSFTYDRATGSVSAATKP